MERVRRLRKAIAPTKEEPTRAKALPITRMIEPPSSVAPGETMNGCSSLNRLAVLRPNGVCTQLTVAIPSSASNEPIDDADDETGNAPGEQQDEQREPAGTGPTGSHIALGHSTRHCPEVNGSAHSAAARQRTAMREEEQER